MRNPRPPTRERTTSTEESLDSASRKHLLPQVVLVLAYRAVPRLDGLVLAHQNLLRNLVEEPRKVISTQGEKREGRGTYLKS